MAVMDLSFEYDAADADGKESAPDPAGERRARFLLERFGAVELDCARELQGALATDADYVVDVDGDARNICLFVAETLPRLRRLGFQIEIAADFPWQVAAAEMPWYARLDPCDGAKADWFNLELGIEIDGRRVNLLPALLDLLEQSPRAARLESLLPTGSRPFALQTVPGHYVLVPPERLRIVIKVLREIYDEETAPGGPVFLPPALTGALVELDRGFSGAGRGLEWQGATAVHERAASLLARPSSATSGAAVHPRGLRATLRPYQSDGVAFLQHLRAHDVGGLLADDMGLGKTLQTIAHILLEKESGRMDAPAVVVAPTSAIINWRRELARFAPGLRVLAMKGQGRRRLWRSARQHDVLLVTYATLLRDEALTETQHFHLVVLDEAQAIKNPRSRCRAVVAGLRARYRLCLTGTPLENNLGELWSLLDFAAPGLLGDEDWFRTRFSIPIERRGDHAQLATLRDHVAPFILRRRKEEVARELPPKTELALSVELEGPQRDLYESLRVAAHAEVRRAIEKKGLGASTITILGALMRLRQCCCDPRLVPGDAAREVQRSAKYEAFMELVRRQLADGRRLLVFSQFTRMLALLGQGLRDEGIAFVTLTGATVDRQTPIDAFERGQADVFLISLKAGGTALNLTSADTVIHYDPWWNPAARRQATDRAHRIGQRKPVFVHNLIVAGSVEEEMVRLQERKQRLADDLLDDAGACGPRLSERDVERLFSRMPAER
jgi:superfamily II DNA or RNA helicase